MVASERSGARVRVAVDVTPTIGRRSGIGQLVHHLVDELRHLDDLELVPFAVTWRGRDQPGVAQRAPMPARPLRALWTRTDHPVIEHWTGRVDVVHGTNFVVPPSRRAAQLVSVHDLTPVRFPQLCTRDTLAYPGLVQRAVRRGAHVHTDSQFVADEVCDWLHLGSDRVHVVRPGVPGTDAVTADRASTSETTRGTKPGGATALPAAVRGGRYVLFVGTVEPRKNLPMLVRAFGRLPADEPAGGAGTGSAPLLVIAGAEAWGADELSIAIDALPEAARARVVRLDYVDDATRAALLHDAYVFAYPSRYEGFGFPPVEAMRAGVPVVATDAGSLPEVLGDAALLVPADDEDAFADALQRLWTDVELGDRLRAAGYERAARYRWGTCASEMATVYRSLAGAQPRPSQGTGT